MEPSDWISIVALIFSIVSFFFAFRLTYISNKSAVRPVLVFVFQDETGWSLLNIGKGPALNVLIAKRNADDWYDPIRVPPLSKDSKFSLSWWVPVDAPEAGVAYTDFQGREYSSTCKNDLSTVYDKRILPIWDEKEIKRYWRYSPEIRSSES